MSALKTPLKISGTGYLVDAGGFVMAYCSDGRPCEEIQEVVRRSNVHTELLEALEAMLNADSGTVEERKDVRIHARSIIAKARN